MSPGGAIELNETVLDALKREIYEETGINLSNPKLLMILSGEKEIFYYPNGDITHYVDLIFYDKINSEENINPHDKESDSIGFYPLDSLPEDNEYLRGTKRILEKYKNHDYTIVVD